MKKLLGIVVLGLLLSSNAIAQIIFKKCNLSPNMGTVDVVLDVENNLIKTVDRKNANEVNFFEIYDTTGDTFFWGRNWVGSKLINQNIATKYDENFFNKFETVVQKDIIVSTEFEIVTSVIKINNEFRKSVVEDGSVYQKEFEIYKQLKEMGLERHIKSECKGSENNIAKANREEREQIQKSLKKNNTDSFSKKLWKSFVTVMEQDGKKYFDAAVDAYYGTGALKSSQHCVTTNVGGKVQIFCKSY